MKKTKYTLLAMLAMATPAYSAVTIVDSFNNGGVALAPTENAGEFSYTFTSAQLNSFTAAGSGKLVFGFTGRQDDGSAQGGPVPTSVTYAGATLNLAGSSNANRGSIGIWYLDNVASDGDLVINFGTAGTTTHMGFSIFALDGLADGGPSTGAVTRSNLIPTIELGAGGGFVLNVSAGNNQTPSTTASYETDFQARIGPNGLLSQHLVTQVGGDFTPDLNGNNNANSATFGFAAVPEPTTALLGGLGMLCLLRRRR
ncbi:MAG: PEP-CTERM sorting domain-containing protein [Luteolibacter sp.]